MKKGRVMRPFAVLAERVGFEPTSDFSLPDFESGPLWPLRYLSIAVLLYHNRIVLASVYENVFLLIELKYNACILRGLLDYFSATWYNTLAEWKKTLRLKNVSVAQPDRVTASDFQRLRGHFPKKLLYIVGVGNSFGNKTTMHKKITPKITPYHIAYKLSAKIICACSLIG